jgi:hypothetical protein
LEVESTGEAGAGHLHAPALTFSRPWKREGKMLTLMT